MSISLSSNDFDLSLNPGLAKRVPDDTQGEEFPFSKVVRQAESFRPDAQITFQRIHRAVDFGLTELKANEQRLLSVLVSRLSTEQLKSGECFVWMGNWLLCQMLGVGDRTLRVLKRSLEEKGLVLRHYDRRNRGAEGEHLDLRPFLARLPEFLEKAEALFASSRERFEQQQVNRSWSECGAESEAESRRREGGIYLAPNSHNQTVVSVQEKEKKETPGASSLLDDQPEDEAPAGLAGDGPETEFVLPGTRAFWRGCGKRGSPRHRTALCQLKRLRVVCEDFASRITDQAIEEGDIEAIVEATAGYVRAHFDPKRNPLDSLGWGFRRHGWKACLIAVLAQRDETVIKPDSFLGALCSRDIPELDLGENLQRVLSQCEAEAADLSAEGTPEPDKALKNLGTSRNELSLEGNASLAGMPQADLSGPGSGSKAGEAKDGPAFVDPNRSLWLTALALLEEREPELYRHWFKKLRFSHLEGTVLHLWAGQQFICDFCDRYSEALRHTLEETGLKVSAIQFHKGKPKGNTL